MKISTVSINLLVLLATVTFTDGGSIKLPVYTQGYTADEFLYQQNLPEMTQNTFCFWINLEGDNDGYTDNHLFSISTAANDNTYLIWFGSGVFITFYGSGYVIAQNLADVAHLFVGWHKHCFTWIRDSFFKWYAEVNILGHLELLATISNFSHTLPSGGALILMQEQDGHFSNLDVTQAATGKIAWVNMWDYAMSDEAIKMLRCRDEGNIVNWNTLSQQGADHIHYEWFQCQDGELKTLEKKFVRNLRQEITLCKIPEASLVGAMNIYSETVETPFRCVLLCTKSDSCLSANYQYSTGMCTLNDDIDQGNEGDFSVNLGSDYVHFTTRECTDA